MGGVGGADVLFIISDHVFCNDDHWLDCQDWYYLIACYSCVWSVGTVAAPGVGLVIKPDIVIIVIKLLFAALSFIGLVDKMVISF